MRRLGAIIFTSLILAVSFASAQTRTLSYFHQEPRPTGNIVVDRPVIEFPVWSDEGHVFTVVEAKLNGKAVAAEYSTTSKTAILQITEALTPGSYKAEIVVLMNGKHRIERTWTFEVGQATAPTENLSSAFAAAVVLIDRLRAKHGLDQVRNDNRLLNAAYEHTTYMVANSRLSHTQARGKSFTGTDLRSRVSRYGFYGGVSEVIGFTSEGGLKTIEQLFHAPYHRISFLKPGGVSVGGSIEGEYACVLFGAPTKSELVLSPANGMTDVPTTWINTETPDPLRNQVIGKTVGYPIVIADFSMEITDPKIIVRSSSIRSAAGQPIKHFVNDSSNDAHASNSALLIPAEPLQKGTIYTVSVDLTTSRGLTRQEWTFKTDTQ